MRLLELLGLRPPASDPGMQDLARMRQQYQDPMALWGYYLGQRQRYPRSLPMRNAEHGAFAQAGWPVGALAPAYGAYKQLGHQMPQEYQALWDQLLGSRMGVPLYGASPASWQEMQYGLLPFMGGLPR